MKLKNINPRFVLRIVVFILGLLREFIGRGGQKEKHDRGHPDNGGKDTNNT